MKDGEGGDFCDSCADGVMILDAENNHLGDDDDDDSNDNGDDDNGDGDDVGVADVGGNE